MRRILFWLCFGLAMLVGGLQMYGVRGGWLTDYGADLFGPAWL